MVRKLAVGSTIEPRLRTCHSDDGSGRCRGSDGREVCRNSHPSTPLSSITSTRNAVTPTGAFSSRPEPLLSSSGAVPASDKGQPHWPGRVWLPDRYEKGTSWRDHLDDVFGLIHSDSQLGQVLRDLTAYCDLTASARDQDKRRGALASTIVIAELLLRADFGIARIKRGFQIAPT